MNKQYLTMLPLLVMTSLATVATQSKAGTPPQVCFFENSQYTGSQLCVGVGTRNVPPEWNDKASSVRIPQGYRLTMFENSNSSGRAVVLENDDPNFAQSTNLNDTLSSYQIELVAKPSIEKPVCLYEHTNYQGGSICLANGTAANLFGPWNDFASSIKVLPGYAVTLSSDASGGGQILSTAVNNPNLVTSNFNDLASWARVQSTSIPCPNCNPIVDVTSVSITNTQGQKPSKGDTLRLTFTLRNTGPAGLITLVPTISSTRFSDFSKVPLGSASVGISSGETKNVTIDAGPFIDDLTRGKTYAIGRGGYRVENVRLTSNLGTITDSSFTGQDFIVNASNVVLTAVVYDADYFRKIGYTKSPETYMTEVLTRPSEIFAPNMSPVGIYQFLGSGFDQMISTQHKFRTVPGFTNFDKSQGQFCEQTTAYGGKSLGLIGSWTTNGKVQTTVNNHGFDYLIGTIPSSIGGVACGWLGVQVSGTFDSDTSLNRSQIVAVHESGHLFGAPHCDPLQGYVMCAGELHPHYQENGIFVWHKISRDVMKNPFD